ncbi:hypothetical protein M1585_02860 [Candidatus Parvarchaeota archaeon]|jgi:hypothetical protein|nr:hypothetical protein [Candidatus Parvarchaeota archaeon]
MPREIGIDSGPITIDYTAQNGVTKSFHAQIGVAVSTDDYAMFSKKYDEAISKSLIKARLKRERTIYCNYDFNKIFKITGYPIHQYFFEEIYKHIADMDIIITKLPKTVTMPIFGRFSRENKLKLNENKLDFDNILAHLHNYFPLVCSWRINQLIKETHAEVFLDGITPTEIDGLRHLVGLPILINFSGDRCNPLISTSDILIALIALRLKKNKLFYDRKGLKTIFPELAWKPRVHIITEHDFPYISPQTKPANMDSMLRHPIIFVFRPQNPFIDTDTLKNDVKFAPVFDFAAKIKGAVKFFDGDGGDKHRIIDGDYIIYLEEKGKAAADLLIGLGKKITAIPFNDLKKEYE